MRGSGMAGFAGRPDAGAALGVTRLVLEREGIWRGCRDGICGQGCCWIAALLTIGSRRSLIITSRNRRRKTSLLAKILNGGFRLDVATTPIVKQSEVLRGRENPGRTRSRSRIEWSRVGGSAPSGA